MLSLINKIAQFFTGTPLIRIAPQITLEKLPQLLTALAQGETELDVVGLHGANADCIYFKYENNKYQILYEIQDETYLPTAKRLIQYAKQQQINYSETGNQPSPIHKKNKDPHLLILHTNTDLQETTQLAKYIYNKLFGYPTSYLYEVIP